MKDDFPCIGAFLADATKVNLTWNFDEQQADAIHRYWTTPKFKAEIRKLLKLALNHKETKDSLKEFLTRELVGPKPEKKHSCSIKDSKEALIDWGNEVTTCIQYMGDVPDSYKSELQNRFVELSESLMEE